MQSVFGDADAPIVVELAQNQLYKAFREVGRVMRTVALLRFLADSWLRARVTAATSKAEAYNGFSTWPAVRQPGGVIVENDPAEQEKSVKWELAAVRPDRL